MVGARRFIQKGTQRLHINLDPEKTLSFSRDQQFLSIPSRGDASQPAHRVAPPKGLRSPRDIVSCCMRFQHHLLDFKDVLPMLWRGGRLLPVDSRRLAYHVFRVMD